MPIIKSAKKRVRQSARRHQQNLVTKRDMRSAVKAFEAAIAGGDKKAIGDLLNAAQSALDTAVKKNIIHKNRAARKKSQLASGAKTVLGTTKPTATKKPAAAKPKAAAKKPVATKPAAKKKTPPAAKA